MDDRGPDETGKTLLAEGEGQAPVVQPSGERRIMSLIGKLRVVTEERQKAREKAVLRQRQEAKQAEGQWLTVERARVVLTCVRDLFPDIALQTPPAVEKEEPS